MKTVTGTLPAVAPFDFAHSLSFIANFSPAMGEQFAAGDGITKAFAVAGAPVLVRVTSAPGGVRFVLRGDITASVRTAMEDRIRFWLSLDDDVSSLAGLADDHFAPIERSLRGFHQVKFPTPFENAAWAILGQRSPFPVSRARKDKLVRALGARVETPDGLPLHAFPEPRAVADAGEPELKRLWGDERKARYVHAAAEAFASQDEGWMRTAPTPDVEAWLRDIDGIGPWSSTFILVRGLGRMDTELSFEDALLRAAGKCYHEDGRAATKREAQTWAERYGAQRGYWALYLRAGVDVLGAAES